MLKETLIAVGGIGVGYFLATAVMQKQYDERLDQEIARTKEFFATVELPPVNAKDLEYPTTTMPASKPVVVQEEAKPVLDPSLSPVERSEQLEKIANRVQYNTPSRETKATKVAESKLIIGEREPYVITFEEFDANETEAQQITVSYFAGDGIVVDEVEEVVSAERVEETLGTNNLNKFGTNTEDPNMDPNVLYIRCEKFDLDFEVTRSPGKYSVEVLGEVG